MIIKKVYQNEKSKQKLVSIPAKSKIIKGDRVMIIKVEGELEAMAEKELSAIAKTKTESANQTKAKKILKEIGL